MSTTWQYGPKQFEVPAGQNTVVRLDVPHRGRIKSINLVDTTGAAAGVFEIYDSERVVLVFDDDLASSLSLSSEANEFPPAVFSVTGELAIAGGAYVDKAVDIDYVNSDGTPTNNKRRLWMRINTNSAGPFILKMVIDPVDLSS
jgi:hypothetical protein